MNCLPLMISSVEEFHRKFEIGINVKSQKEMYARCSLLLEELGELGEVLSFRNHLVSEEIADVSYVIIGNLVSLGYYVDKTEYQTIIHSNYEDLILTCGLIARKIRKEWAPEDYEFRSSMISLHLTALQILENLSSNMQFNLISEFMKKHEKLLLREAKKVGDTIVVSHWNRTMVNV